MKKVGNNAFVKIEDVESGAKLISVYSANGKQLLKRGRLCFYDTKYKTIY